jgi:hypothetical protein
LRALHPLKQRHERDLPLRLGRTSICVSPGVPRPRQVLVRIGLSSYPAGCAGAPHGGNALLPGDSPPG